jgi:hypothetical protein
MNKTAMLNKTHQPLQTKENSGRNGKSNMTKETIISLVCEAKKYDDRTAS